MTAKLKPLEPKSMSANGARTSTEIEPRPTKLLTKRPSTASVRNSVASMSITDVETVSNSVANDAITDKENKETAENDDVKPFDLIPDVYKTQGSITYSSCTGYSETTCLCSSIEDASQSSNVKRVSYLERRNWITTERLSELRKKAQDAIKHHKTFTIRGCFYSIRKGLVQRGWVEKLDIHRRAPVNGSCQVILEDVTQHLPLRRPGETRRQHIQKCERNIMSRFLEHMPIDFLWSARKEKTDWIDMARNPNLTINKFHKSPFTTKEGLCNVLRDLHWFFEEGKSETYYPRSYNVWNQDNLAEFCDDYRITACMSMLRFLVDRNANKDLECIYAENGQIPLSSIQFAIKKCKMYVRSCMHLDIDEEVERVWDHDWELFLMHFQMLTQESGKFQKPDDQIQWLLMMDECKKNLLEIVEHWPQSNLDGVLNIWIVKPSNRCRGRGILMMNDIKKIISHVNPPVVNKGRYVVQKYIERPMIIHNCKFDIRQWFLVTNVQPLVIWMYKESYLRFSSQEYDLVNFHESVHLTNHAVQKRYTNGKRDERLPRENMWDCHSFQAYLRQIGKASMWSERIYPGMQRALIGTMLASQETMDRRTNTFELFGADFMISEDCQPWLIEINASPDLGASTSVTARLCPQCLEDVIKVVVDHRNDPKSSTGGFEMIYRQVIPPAPAYLGLNLFLRGTQVLPKNFAAKKEKSKLDALRVKNDRQNSQLNKDQTIKDQLNVDSVGTNASVAFSPRPFIIDFVDCVSNKNQSTNSPASLRNYGQLKSVASLKKPDEFASKESCSPRTRSNAQSSSNLSSSKFTETVKENNVNTTKKAFGKAQDSARRHASCGPRIMSISIQSDENKTQEIEIVTAPDPSGIKCIGSKCGPDSVASVACKNSSSISSSPRKPLETPRTKLNVRSKLKPINTLAKSNTTSKAIGIATDNKPRLTKPTTVATNIKEYRKYLAQSNLQLNKITSKLPIQDKYYNSHFFAVGLSLRAWRSKYNRILAGGSSNAATVLAQNNVSIKQRKTNQSVSKDPYDKC